jgi:hypothetical protein
MPSKRVSLKGKGADLFFGDYAPTNQLAAGSTAEDAGPAATTTEAVASPTSRPTDGLDTASPPDAPVPSESVPRRTTRRSPAPTTTAQDVTLASTLASTTAITDGDAIEAIRKVVKVPGREVSFVRLTPEEKAQLVDVIYTYKRQGMKTTETEINRIALNYLLHDYREHGEHSVLARVLAALLA